MNVKIGGPQVTDFQVSSKSAPTQVLRTPASKTSVSTSQKKMVQFGFGWGPVHTCEPELGGHDPCPQKPEMLIFDGSPFETPVFVAVRQEAITERNEDVMLFGEL